MNLYKFSDKIYASDMKQSNCNEIVSKIWNKHSNINKKPSEIKIDNETEGSIEFYLYTMVMGFPILDPFHYGKKYTIYKIKFENI